MGCGWDIFKAVSAALSMGPFYSTVNHCTCSDQAWPDVEATHKWYSMTVSMKERTFVQRGAGFQPKAQPSVSNHTYRLPAAYGPILWRRYYTEATD